MTSTDLPVWPSVLVVPDGIRDGKAKLSLQITPYVPPSGTPLPGTAISLREWPERVSAISRDIQIYLAYLDHTASQPPEPMLGARERPFERRPDGSVFYPTYDPTESTGLPAPGAAMLWRQIFSGDGYANLHTALAEAASRQSAESAAPQIAPHVDSKLLGDELVGMRVRQAMARASALGVMRHRGQRMTADDAASADAARRRDEMAAWSLAEPSEAAAMPHASLWHQQRRRQFQDALSAYRARTGGQAFEVQHPTSFAELEAQALGKRVAGNPDPRLEAMVSQTQPVGLNRLASRLESVLMTAVIQPEAELTQSSDDAVQAARRKLAGILSYPTLAKYFGMIADLEIPIGAWNNAASAISADPYGAVAAELQGYPIGTGGNWTAYARKPGYFGPCDKAEALAKAATDEQHIKDGLLNLKQPHPSEPGRLRYSLQIVDPIGGALRQMQFARDAGMGVHEETQDPELGGRGLALVDDTPFHEAGERAAREKALITASGDKIQFAGDLLRGLKPVVGIATRGSTSLRIPAPRWRSLVARDLSFDSSVDPAFVSDQARRHREREDGHVVAIIGEQQGNTLIHKELLVWTGESLAAPGRNEDVPNKAEINPVTDLAIGTRIDLASSTGTPDRRLAPLRDGRGYVLGAAASFVNGCGLPMPDAIAIFAAVGGPVLGGIDNTPFPYTRTERLRPPVVLLPPDSPLVERTNIASLYGHSATTLVVRSGDAVGTTRRMLFPDRIEFDRAEQEGMFDNGDATSADKPRGAFRRNLGAELDARGSFPVAIGGNVVPSDHNESNEPSRGSVLRLQSGTPNGREYYPDTYCRSARLHFRPLVPSDGEHDVMTDAVEFWRGSGPEEAVVARPIVLDLKRKAGTGKAQRIQIDRNDDIAIVDTFDGSDVRLKKLAVTLKPATIVDVDITGETDPERILTSHFLGEQMAREWQMQGYSFGQCVGMMRDLLRAGWFPQLQGRQILRLVHAVQRPLDPPRLCGGDLGVYPVVVSVLPKGSASGQLKTWAEEKDRQLSLHQRKYHEWESSENGATCFFVGRIGVEPPSTGAVSCDAQWREFGPEAVSYDATRDRWNFEPPQNLARLFTVPDLSSATSASTVDLLDSGQDDGLAYTFPDGRARKLTLRLTAVSRFLEYFDRTHATSSRPDDLGSCERRSETCDRWVPCTFRPPPAEVTRITPVFDYEQHDDVRRGIFSFVRKERYRLELSTNCHRTGEEETVALAFAQGNPAVCDYAQLPLEPFATSLTRWGSDPVRSTPVPAINLAPDRIVGAGPPIPNLPLYPGVQPGMERAQPGSALPVTIVPLQQKFSSEIGFYADLSLRAPAHPDSDGYMPFVQLGVVRYQPHCVADLELSLPVGHTIQLLPERRGRVEFHGNRDFTVELEGALYPGELHPVLDITLLYEPPGGDEEEIRWQPATVNHQSVQWPNLDPTESNGWKRNFRLPRSRRDHHYGILIEEFERFYSDSGEIERRGPIFGRVIDFGPPQDRRGRGPIAWRPKDEGEEGWGPSVSGTGPWLQA